MPEARRRPVPIPQASKQANKQASERASKQARERGGASSAAGGCQSEASLCPAKSAEENPYGRWRSKPVDHRCEFACEGWGARLAPLTCEREIEREIERERERDRE